MLTVMVSMGQGPVGKLDYSGFSEHSFDVTNGKSQSYLSLLTEMEDLGCKRMKDMILDRPIGYHRTTSRAYHNISSLLCRSFALELIIMYHSGLWRTCSS